MGACTTGWTMDPGGRRIVRSVLVLGSPENSEQDGWQSQGKRSRRGWKRWPSGRCGRACTASPPARFEPGAARLGTSSPLRLDILQPLPCPLPHCLWLSAGHMQSDSYFAQVYHRHRQRSFPDPDPDSDPGAYGIARNTYEQIPCRQQVWHRSRSLIRTFPLSSHSDIVRVSSSSE